MSNALPVVPFVTRDDAPSEAAWLQHLNDAFGSAEVRAIEGLNENEREAARVAIVADPDPKALATLPNLEWVQSLWAGVERLVADLPSRVGIVRMGGPQLADTMSEAVLTWTLALHRDLFAYVRQQIERRWRPHDVLRPEKRTVAVLGLGNLGQRSAERLAANGFEVLGWSRSRKSVPNVETFHGESGFGAVLERADIVIVLLPLTTETHNLLDASSLDRMRPGASIINFARGPIINENALLQRLDSGAIGHAVLDVFNVEPLPDDHPFWTHPRVTVLPHISAPTDREAASVIAASNIERFLRDGTVPPTVERGRGY